MTRRYLVIALLACSAPRPPPPPPPPVSVAPPPVDAAVDAGPTPIEQMLRKLAELTSRMCQCHDSACADRLAAEVGAWGPTSTATDAGGWNEVEAKELAELTERLTRCTADAMTRPGAAR